jgi:hypothetical protein
MLTKEVAERALSSHSTKLRDLLLVVTFLVKTVSVSTETVPEADPLDRPGEHCLGGPVSPMVGEILPK